MRLMVLTAAVVFVTDQILKWVVLYVLDLDNRGLIEVAPPYLVLRMAWNTGINFGILSGGADWMRWVLIAVALAITVWVVVWVRRDGGRPAAMFSAGLLVGGALGNVVDRIVHGKVADFLNMSCCGIENPYAFNVADISIFAGAIGLILFAGGDPKRGKPRDAKKAIR